MLVSMGADIEGCGSSRLVVHGVEPGELHATGHAVVADRIQAATYLAATALCGGEVVLRGARHAHMETVLRRFTEMGLAITDIGDGLAVGHPIRTGRGCAASTWRRCRIPGSPPTTSR
jgi:UDP-N-acetylglucosamine 1-carboxyvinyltransferase